MRKTCCATSCQLSTIHIYKQTRPWGLTAPMGFYIERTSRPHDREKPQRPAAQDTCL
uniref:Uncharacterized protein n=1 Tax=Arundo donax TaxID=35708 RepID=A0A0A9FM26_ARUDO